jgi:outer membrane murein-binding lipoprotein Lpp
MTRTFVVLSALAVAGCVTTGTTGTTAKVDAMPSELQKSIAEYRACVDAKGRIKACEAQRLAIPVRKAVRAQATSIYKAARRTAPAAWRYSPRSAAPHLDKQ